VLHGRRVLSEVDFAAQLTMPADSEFALEDRDFGIV
jgi:hypothetical protein